MSLPHVKCLEVLQAAAKDNGITESDMEMSMATFPEDIYLGENFRITIKDKSNPDKVMYFYMKAPAIIDRLDIPMNKLYKREIFVYTELFKAFQEMQNYMDLSPENQFTFTKYYGSCDEEYKEVILLEDLREKSFTCLPRLANICLDHIALMVTHLAKFHALSMVLRHKQPVLFKNLANVAENITNSVEALTSYKAQVLEQATAAMTRQEHKQTMSTIRERYLAGLDAPPPYTAHNVFLHGECYVYNALFGMMRGALTSARFVDFQYSYYGPPAVDLVCLLMSSTSRALRLSHHANLVKHYRLTIDKVVDAYGLDPRAVFPEAALDRQLRDHGYLGLVAAVALSRPISVLKYETEREWNTFDLRQLPPLTGAELDDWRDHVEEILDECMRCGYVSV